MSMHIPICCLGDSLTAGGSYPASYRRFLQAQLATVGLGAVFMGAVTTGVCPNHRSFGYGGHTVSMLTALVSGWTTPVQPHVALILIGTNDVNGAISAAAAAAVATSDIPTLHAAVLAKWPNAVQVYGRIPLLPAAASGAVDAFNDAMATALASAQNAVVVDAGGALTAGDLDVDEVHPVESGAAKLAAGFATYWGIS